MYKIENFFLEISVAWKLRDGVHFVWKFLGFTKKNHITWDYYIASLSVSQRFFSEEVYLSISISA